MTSQILSELETDMNILFPGSADSLPAACLCSRWDAGTGLEEGGAFVRAASPSFLPGEGSCGAVPCVKRFCVPVSQRHGVPEARPREPALWLPYRYLIHCRVLLV